MRPIILGFAMFVLPAMAQEMTTDAVFVPATAQSPSKVVYATGAEKPVLNSIDGKRPADCPDGAFWVKGDVSLVSCADDEAYRLVPLVDPSKWSAFANALALQKIKGDPRPGTDDPGPMKNKAPINPESKP